MRPLNMVAFAGALFLSGCSLPYATNSQILPLLPMAVPIQPNAQHENTLLHIDHILQRKELSKNDRARLYFERGMINDSLGLRDIAQFDFDRSLFLNPAQAELYNILGMHYTQNGTFDSAYEAFDSALELDKDHKTAQRNRGVALYYGKRLNLAHRDLLAFYNANPNDPYSALWLYLVEYNQLGKEKARELLNQRYQKSDKTAFGWQIARLYLDQITEQQFLAYIQKNSETNDLLAERLVEGYFFLGKRYQLLGDEMLAIALYKLAMSSNKYEFVEHRYSYLELSLIASRERE